LKRFHAKEVYAKELEALYGLERYKYKK